ncbi:ABC transporter permease [Mucilaginibacter sp. PAMB04274]|uniref:ABC transporter permease n=1 Tax=Mucilaginibacter sp. PAMB04274 TaxID=3138568 RepID=UPI0031F6BA1E
MIKNYLKTAWRNLLRSKVYSLIAVIGLAIGLSVSTLLFWGVDDELQYDTAWPDAANIYRLNARIKMSDDEYNTWTNTPAPIAATALRTFPGVEMAVRYNREQMLVSQGEEHIMEKNVAYTEPSFFKMFHVKLLRGSEQVALSAINNVVLSRDAAVKYFGSINNAVGKTLTLSEKLEPYTVSAIMENMPERSTVRMDMLLSLDMVRKNYGGNGNWKTIDEDWGNFYFTTFLRLKPGTNVNQLAKQLSAIHVKNNGYVKAGDVTYICQPLNMLRLYNADLSPSGIKIVRFFMIIGVLILLIAVINYINLSTARATKRAKEVGLRRTIGASRQQLLIQFVTEFILILIAALLLAAALMPVLTPFYQEISGKLYNIDYWKLSTIKIVGWVALGTIILASVYPAWILSSFNPNDVLKANFNKAARGGWLRKGLVIMQFTFSVLLIICTIVITKQLKFIQTKNLGYDRENVLMVPLNGKVSSQLQRVMHELKSDKSIRDVSFASGFLLAMGGSTDNINWPGKVNNQAHISPMQIAANFTTAMQMKFADGQGFTGSPADSAYYLINESAARMMALKHPVGTIINLWGKQGEIKGVIKDFNNASLKEEIKPTIFSAVQASEFGGYLYIRARAEATKQAIAKTEELYKSIDNIRPFEYRFLDEDFDAMYRKDIQTAKLFKAFASVAILLSCLGLFGLAVFTAERRTKEIGIRKVLGASVQSISFLISKEFTGLVIIANLIAWPIAWYIMHQWMQEFTYRTEISWYIFVIAGFFSLLLAVITVSSQAVKAAIVNPVKSLKTE